MYASRTAVLLTGVCALVLMISGIVLAADPMITEFLASNSGGHLDGEGEASDWIEIFNPGPRSIDLQGWTLTDDASTVAKWSFPSTTLRSGQYLVIFASGKDRAVSGAELHTNFKLNAGGEYLALAKPDGTIVHAFDPEYPSQDQGVSYGLVNGEARFFSIPTPGLANNDGSLGTVADVTMDQEHGLLASPVTVTLSCETAGATIRYTVDGSEPTASSGNVYATPLELARSTVLRARAFRQDWTPSKTTTRSYLYLQDVANQSASPNGFPATWGINHFESPAAPTPADYEVDPEIVNAGPYADKTGTFTFADALRSIPTLSIVMEPDDLFNMSSDPQFGGIYTHPESDGPLWERPASVEWIPTDASEGFQVDCGIRIYGGMGRSPWAKKHTFRLFFRGSYGPTRLEYPVFGDEAADSFDTLILRANFNDGWHMLWDAWKLNRVQSIRDEWIRASYIDMGRLAPHGTFVHLYINGLYWGMYNPVERPDGDFSADYLGGDAEDYDGLHDGDPIDGDRVAWEQLMSLANSGLSDVSSYQRIQGNNPDGTRNPDIPALLDVEALADYMILNFYAGTDDWDMHNWYAGRRRDGDDGYQIYVWDGEIIALDLEGQNLVDLDMDGCPSRVFQKLRENQEFNVLFGDRAYKHLFNDGVLTPENAAGRYQELADFVDRAMVAESARWGDAVRETPYTREVEWSTERDWLLNEYFVQRGGILLGFLREAGLYPDTEPPRLSINGTLQYGGAIEAGAKLSMTAETGQVYYTTDGTDPRPAGSGETALPGSVLVSRGSDWEYLDDGSIPTEDWRTSLGSWTVGTAEFGYGDGDETTVVNCGTTQDCSMNYVTTYFRKRFNVEDVSSIDALRVQLVRDDGAVIYLNGVEIARSNMPDGPVTPQTLAFDSEITEITWQELEASSAALRSGPNTLAIEVHQWSTTSSDISFDLELVAVQQEKVVGSTETAGTRYAGPITLLASTTIKARTYANGVWSALAEATYTVTTASPLVLNELMANNVSTLADPDEPDAYEDWIEIYNASNVDVDMGGMYLSDDASDPTRYSIPSGVIVPAGGYILFWADNDNEEGDVHLNFALSASGEELLLVAADGTTVIDHVEFGAQAADRSYGRSEDGTGNWGTMSATPGMRNE